MIKNEDVVLEFEKDISGNPNFWIEKFLKNADEDIAFITERTGHIKEVSPGDSFDYGFLLGLMLMCRINKVSDSETFEELKTKFCAYKRWVEYLEQEACDLKQKSKVGNANIRANKK